MSGSPSAIHNRLVGVKLTEESLVPVVIVKAAGKQADQLLNDVKTHGGIPVVRSAALTAQLYRIPIDQMVTPDLFPMMAALLAHVIHVDQYRQNTQPSHNHE